MLHDFCQQLSFCFLTSNHVLSVSVSTTELVDCLIVPILTTPGSGVVRRKRRLNQALSVLSLSLGFLSVLYCCYLGPFCGLHWFVFCTYSVSWLFWFVSTSASD